MIFNNLRRIFLLYIILFITISCNRNSPENHIEGAVYIKENAGKYQLIRNGKPFYIKGGAANSGFLKELRDAGANTARIYDTIDLESTLDKAHKLGLAVVVDVPLPKFETDPQFYEDQKLFAELYKRTARVIEQHKNHPALLYWNLGNELYYPYLYKSTKFFENYNSLIDLVHDIDPDHPVSTTTIGANKLRVLSIRIKSPQLDFISFNSFGSLSSFSRRLLPIQPVWNGPFVITEWGVNGPWEAKLTSWGAPIEETSTKKAEQILQRHQDYIKPLKKMNSLGSFVFYWGQKNEITPTWYSLFDEKGLKTQPVFELQQEWKGTSQVFAGPELNYILLEGKGAQDNILLESASEVNAEVVLPKMNDKNFEFLWEIRNESWYESHISTLVNKISAKKGKEQIRFRVPEKEGPYRLFLYVTNNTEYVATANIPFYVLNSRDEE